ncbi:glycosyltransferase [Serinicoccus marinus]|uniref:glycosyltransferase n=1 Tax=Serinicoccus marinus TaxID=247333 RepID=UPI0024928604|nr:glycosyltransferase [Serinicoccus marinus]
MTIRVRQIPAGHAYVAALLPVRPDPRTEPAVVHLPDPPVPGAPPGQWWPHPALDPAWLREHASEQDLVHVHFGLEGQDTARLRTWLEMLREQRLPLVHTVHDLDHPQLRDQRRHREHLELLVEHAAGLLTLTEGAAEVVQRNLGRRPLVVPHPHVAPLPLVGRPRPARSGPLTVGLHLKSLRANLAPLRSLPALAAAVREVDSVLPSGARLEVRAHPEVLDPDRPGHDPRVVGLLTELGGPAWGVVDVRVAPRLPDDQLWDYLRGLDVSVLPYAWATHSGWVEACRDLGTWVLAPEVGHLREQGGVLSWGPASRPPDPGRLAQLLLRAAGSPPPRVDREERVRQREAGAALHTAVYAAVLSGRRVDAETEGVL